MKTFKDLFIEQLSKVVEQQYQSKYPEYYYEVNSIYENSITVHNSEDEQVNFIFDSNGNLENFY